MLALAALAVAASLPGLTFQEEHVYAVEAHVPLKSSSPVTLKLQARSQPRRLAQLVPLAEQCLIEGRPVQLSVLAHFAGEAFDERRSWLATTPGLAPRRAAHALP